ncbi:MAG: dihydropteroate synthase [Chitinophagaceae bacterium]|nr:dihydropteroate synthase [Chitinophagaceae bacterium]
MFTLNCKGRLLVAHRPLIMGIINLTPDSFYEGSRAGSAGEVIRQTERMLTEGADIIDLGAQSTRPRSVLLTEEEELSRLTGVVEILTKNFPHIILSADTFYSRVARECVDAGASMINDISGGNMDERMIAVAGMLNVPYVCMHMKGTPQTMTQHAHYKNIAVEVLDYFIAKSEACRLAGIKDLILDPGFGFSKNREHNFDLLLALATMKLPGRPVMVGLSRKSTIYKTLGVTAAEALNGTTVVNTIALMNGADILRVHDVKEAKECVTLVDELKGFHAMARS